MLLIKTSPKTPKQRWKQYVKCFYPLNYIFNKFSKIKNTNKSILGNHLIKGQKYLYKNVLYKYFIIKPSLVPIIIYGFGFKKNPLKEFVWGKNLYNQIFFFLHVNYMYPGFKILNYLSFFNKMKTPCNQIFPIYLLPINSIICFIFNKNNQYMTFSKSSGCNAIKKKTHKKYKLIYVELPSLKITIIKYDTYCVYSNNKNNFLNKVVEGGWGFSHKNKKLISVRGVAKNPVDHPNGGRTKAKQPELSPWGWVAKHNK